MSSRWQDFSHILSAQPQSRPDKVFESPVLSPPHPDQDDSQDNNIHCEMLHDDP